MTFENHEIREQVIFSVAQAVLPFYASRYDYSQATQYESIADQAYVCAEALVAKHEARLIAAIAKDQELEAKAAKEAKPNG